MQSILDNIIPLVSNMESHIHSILDMIPTAESVVPTLWRYLPFTPFVALFWPFVLTFIVTIASASTWIFWLFTSLVFGFIQLIYALYQFGMIAWDLGVLGLLKSFALMRSSIRYYTIKSGFSKKDRMNSSRVTKRGRRLEWRKKLDGATTYGEFLEVEIQEPVPIEENDSIRSIHVNGNEMMNNNTNRNRGSEKEKNNRNAFFRMFFGSLPSSRNRSKGETKLRKSQSCAEFHKIPSPNHSALAQGSTPLSPTRSKSTNTLIKSLEEYADIEKELGKVGSMLLHTTSRLRDARIQATVLSSKPTPNYMSRVSSTGGMHHLNNTHTIESISETTEECLSPINSLSPTPSSSPPPSPKSLVAPKTINSDANNPASELKFFLSGMVKRNHLSVNDLLIQDARSVMECGRHQLSSEARGVIMGYHEEVERCLEWISESGMNVSDIMNPTNSGTCDSGNGHEKPAMISSLHFDHKIADMELSSRINLIRKMKHNMGRSALMLSGGGAQAMYHLGTIKALCESKLYDDIGVISGTSGGSISAAMCAIKTREELLRDVCLPTVSTDFGLNGEQKRRDIRWFPRLIDMGQYWLKKGLLVDSEDFKRCCEFYFGDITFEKAFERTGKHVCITVSASRAESKGAQRLLLNHISTPHVTIASAVAASCALPGVMAPAKLRTKNSDGVQELFEVDGVEWIDGSVQADLPFKRISTLFNVSNYIVCQTNFHVLPFLNKAHHPNMNSFYWKAFQTCEWDVRSRALNLSRLGLFPRIFGQDISKVFKQKYHGDLTLVPRFTTMQVFGLKSLVNPDVEDMKVYLQNGQTAAWPYLSVIKEMLRLERAIDKCMSKLIDQRHQLAPENDWDDIESITSASQSNRSRPLGSRRQTELLKQKVLSLELENSKLRQELNQMKKNMSISDIHGEIPTPDNNGSKET